MKRLLLVFMLLLTGAAALVAQRTITGVVTDDKGEALIGASVVVKGTSTGTVSDLDGSFRLQVPADATTLMVSYTGYSTKEVALTAATNYQIDLATDVVSISEIVVVGYGTQQKRDLQHPFVGAPNVQLLPTRSLRPSKVTLQRSFL